MTMPKTTQTCFNCNRTVHEIPVATWQYREKVFVVCAACMPTLIHEWEQVVIRLETQQTGKNHG